MNDLPLFDTLPLTVGTSYSGVAESERDKARKGMERAASKRAAKAWLERLREALAGLYRVRAADGDAYVTSDDARKLMRQRPELCRPVNVHPNAMGSLFRTSEWTPKDGFDTAGNPIRAHASTAPGSHGNPLVRWEHVA